MITSRRLRVAVWLAAAWTSALWIASTPAEAACPPIILDAPATFDVGDLVMLEGVCCSQPVPSAEGTWLIGLQILLLIAGAAILARRRVRAARLAILTLIVSPTLLHAPGPAAQSCEAELTWQAQSTHELFVGSGPSFTFMPTRPGTFVVTLTSGPDASTRNVEILLPLTCVDAGDADPTGTDVWSDALGQAAVVIPDPSACQRSYDLTSTAPSIGGSPPAPRAIAELPGTPTLRTGHLVFDSLYALALDDLAQNEATTLIDPTFDGGAPLPCPTGGCYRSSSTSDWMGTREAAYATHLGGLALDPIRARNALALRLSDRRSGGAAQIVQDPGTGGGYPVSSDRVAWVLGAEAVMSLLDPGDQLAFATTALDALENTLEQDRVVLFDASDGLYCGETSFLDLREQTYPARTATRVAEIAGSKALGTNLLHLQALEATSTLADALGNTTLRDRYAGWATLLRVAIHDAFWDAGAGLFSAFTSSNLDPAVVRRYDLLGSALAVILDVASSVEASSVLGGYPHYGPGAPLIWPQQQDVPIQYNRASSPFVSAYWLRAAAAAGHDAVAERMIDALVRAAALNLSNVSLLGAETGAAWESDGAASGPGVNANHQLSSIAGYLSMIHHTIFGLQPELDGLHVRPFVPAALRSGMLGGTRRIVLNDVAYQGHAITVVLHLPDAAGTGALEVAARHLNGTPFAGDLVPDGLLQSSNRVDVFLAAGTSAPTTLTEVGTTDFRDVFGPGTPSVTNVLDVSGDLEVGLDPGGEVAPDISYRILRDGAVVADGLPGSSTAWTDTGVDPSGPDSFCYVAETTFTVSGNHSQHSPPQCWWGAGASHVSTIDATGMTNVGGTLTFEYGRLHWSGWGDPGHSLTVASFVAAQTGPHQLLVRYGNGAGAVGTGITCAVKRMEIEDIAASTIVAEGAIVMPHLGTWDAWAESIPLEVDLVAGRSYRITLASDDDMSNMSVFEHFATWSGVGGASGPFNHPNVAEILVLAR